MPFEISAKGEEMQVLQRLALTVCAVVLVALLPGATEAQDVEGSKDHPLFNRLPDYHIDTYRVSEFDSYGEFVWHRCPRLAR